MELSEVLSRRRMCRSFSDRPVSPVVVDRLLERALRAPSAGHVQGWSFLVLEGREQADRFWRADADPAWLENPSLPGVLLAPVVVIPFCTVGAYLARYSEPDKVAQGLTSQEGWSTPFWVVDVSFATMLLLLGAVEEGLGALFFRLRGDPAKLREAFGVPDAWDPIGAVAIGWPGADHGPVGSAVRGRRPWSEVVHRGRW